MSTNISWSDTKLKLKFLKEQFGLMLKYFHPGTRVPALIP